MQLSFLVAGSKKCNKHLKQLRVFKAQMRRFATKDVGFAIEGLVSAIFLRICGPLVCLGFGVGSGHRGFSACTVCLARFGNLLWL